MAAATELGLETFVKNEGFPDLVLFVPLPVAHIDFNSVRYRYDGLRVEIRIDEQSEDKLRWSVTQKTSLNYHPHILSHEDGVFCFGGNLSVIERYARWKNWSLFFGMILAAINTHYPGSAYGRPDGSHLRGSACRCISGVVGSRICDNCVFETDAGVRKHFLDLEDNADGTIIVEKYKGNDRVACANCRRLIPMLAVVSTADGRSGCAACTRETIYGTFFASDVVDRVLSAAGGVVVVPASKAKKCRACGAYQDIENPLCNRVGCSIKEQV